MGSPKDEKGRVPLEDQVLVKLANGFWLGQYELTQDQWTRVMHSEREDWRGGDYPARNVSWEDAIEFCKKLTAIERRAGRLPVGWEYTLPREAQWEYACRAGTTTHFNFGDDESKLSDYAWWGGSPPTHTGWSAEGNAAKENYAHRVGKKNPNRWGLYDMHGNVGEWCRDVYTVKMGRVENPESYTRPGSAVVRGGWWWMPAYECRSARRNIVADASIEFAYIGFRVALVQSGK